MTMWYLQRKGFDGNIEISHNDGKYTVGRSKDNTITCLSLYVSRQHCQIIQKKGILRIVDLKSGNGTFLNETQIPPLREIPIEEGDEIGIGVCQVIDPYCFVYKVVCRNKAGAVKLEPNITIISDSESSQNENDEVKAKILKRPAEKVNMIQPKIPRLEDLSSKTPYNPFTNISNKSSIDQEASVVQVPSSSGQDVMERHNRMSESCKRDRMETVILNLKSPDKNKFKCIQENILSSSTPVSSESVCMNTDKNSNEIIDNCVKENEEINRVGQLVHENNVNRAEDSAQEEKMLNSTERASSEILEIASKVQTLLAAKPHLKGILMQKFLSLETNVASDQISECLNKDESDVHEKRENVISCDSKKSQTIITEHQDDLRSEKDDSTRPNTSTYCDVTRSELVTTGKCDMNKTENVVVWKTDGCRSEPSTSKNIPGSELENDGKGGNSIDSLYNNSNVFSAKECVTKEDNTKSKIENPDLNENSQKDIDEMAKSIKDEKHSTEVYLNMSKKEEESLLFKSNKKQKTEGKDGILTKSVLNTLNVQEESSSLREQDPDFHSETKLKNILKIKNDDMERREKDKDTATKFDSVGKSHINKISKNKDHKSKESRLHSTSSESSRNESSIISSRNSSIESNKLDNSENRTNLNSNKISGNTLSLSKGERSDSEPKYSCKSHDNSSSNDPIKVEDKLIAAAKNSQPVVRLKRIDSPDINSQVNETHLNHTLEDDIIIISDDEDSLFPSSQVFDEQESELATKEEILDDPSFCKEIEDEDAAIFEEEDEIDAVENEWLAKLSQDIIRTCSQSEFESKSASGFFPKELDEKEFSDVEVIKNTNLDVPSHDDDREKDHLSDDELFSKRSKKLDKRKDSLSKSKSHVKPFILDALPMPPRRAKLRGISAGEATRLYNERKENSELTKKAKSSFVSESTFSKAKKLMKKKNELRSRSCSEETNFLTAVAKKHIVDLRKEKLKAISEKEKEAAAAANLKANSNKVPSKARVKVTNRNRGAFLTEGIEDHKENKNLSSAPSASLSLSKENTKAPVKPEPKKEDMKCASAPMKSIKDLPRIPKKSNVPSESIPSTSKCDNFNLMESVLADKQLPEILPALSSNKTLPLDKIKGKKTVRFKEGSALVEIRMIPIAENSQLNPVAQKKDAPPPRKIASIAQPQKGPILEEVIYDILCWNPKWLKDQASDPLRPPPVAGDKIWPMLSSFVSYNDYLKVLTPLVLLDLWSAVTKESQLNPNDPRKAALVVGIDQVDQRPFLTPNQKQLMHICCHAVLSDFQSPHPRIGDLVYLELELENNNLPNHQPFTSQRSPNKRTLIPIFAYVKSLIKEMVTGTTIVHKEILPHALKPTCKVSLILQSKFIPYDVKMSHAMRIKVVSYIKSDLRLFQALAHLPSSPLCNHILKPEKQNFMLPYDKNVKFAPIINQETMNDSQKRAVLQTAKACSRPEPAICLIQGPAGTGKSHVIINLIMQVLYGQGSYKKHGKRKNSPRILLCAPSNTAIDELVIRLLQVRHKITKEERFKMVRTGRQETMHPQVKDISLMELAKRDVKNSIQSLESMESVELEIRTLEALRNSKILALESARKNNMPNVRQIEFKLGEVERRLCHMRRSKVQNLAMDPREIARMERDAQERVLLGADIIATTLSSCYNTQMEGIYMNNRESGFQFTCCIVDEATQSQELETLIPLMLGVSKLVLVGDANQLPATVLSMMAKEYGLGKSLFARLQECFEDTVRNPVQFLETQYRMHPEICHFPNKFFYSGRLRTAPSVSRKSPLVPYCILSLDYKQDNNEELVNTGEAELVGQLLLGIIEKVGSKYSIAVITPYHKQRIAILEYLQSHSQGSQNVEVNTIDSFQGQERDIVVVSCVRTEKVGFLADSQRLNVALTRARHSLILCGNFTSLRDDRMWRALLENARERKLLKHVPSNVAKHKDELLKFVLCE